MGLNRAELSAAIAAHGPVTRILIAGHAGSTPRETGTSMLVWDGGQSGTIGGGALEWQAVEKVREISAPTVLKFPLGPSLGQCCGGSVTLILEPFTAANLPPDGPHSLRQITGNTPQPLSITRALRTSRATGAPPPLTFTDGWLLEPLTQANTPLWLYGAGHVGRAIVETLNGLPFDIIWVDTAANRFPDHIPDTTTQLIAANPAQAARHAPSDAHHLVLTYSHAIDLDLCHQILGQPHASLGLIGSATKRARFTKRLVELGHTPQATAQIICPIGNRALGKEPKAIALGIATELLQNSARQTQTKALP